MFLFLSSKCRLAQLMLSVRYAGALLVLGLVSIEKIALVHRLHGGVHLPKLPLGQRDACLLLYGGHERGQHLIDIAHRGGGITTAHLAAVVAAVAAIAAARVPDADFGLQTTDGFGIGLGQLNIRAFLDHHVLNQARGPAKSSRQLGVGVGHGGDTLCLLDLGDGARLGVLLGGIVVGLGINARLVDVGVGHALVRFLSGAGIGRDFIGSRIGSLLLALTGNGGLDDVPGAQALDFGGGALQFDLLLELFILGLQSALGFDASNVHVPVQHRLARVELGLGLGALNVPLRLLHGRLGVDLGNFTILLALALGLADVAPELGCCHVDSGLVGGALVGLAGERLKVD